jgi:hypothetical protein
MNYRHDFNHRKPIAIALLYFAAITIIALLLTSCGSRTPKGAITETIYVDSLERLQPRNIHEEMNLPIYRVYWSNGYISTTHGFTPSIGDSTTATTYIYK